MINMNLNIIIDAPLYGAKKTYGIQNSQYIRYQQIQQHINKFKKEFKIYQDHQEYYKYDGQQVILNSTLSFSKEVSIVLRFKHLQLSYLQKRINQIQKKIQTKKKLYASDLPGIEKGKSLKELNLKKQKYSYNSTIDAKIQIAIFFSNPLVSINKNQAINIYDQFIDIRSQNQRIKSTLKQTQPSIILKTTNACKQRLDEILMRLKSRIIHLICNVELVDNQVYLSLQSSNRLGVKENLKVQKIFQNVLESNKPELLILIGYNSTFAGQKLKNQGIDFIVTIESVCYNEDKLAQSFLQTFYKEIFQGKPINVAYDKAIQQILHDNFNCLMLCCCYHQHQQDCYWKQKVNKFGLQSCHKLYHNFLLRCINCFSPTRSNKSCQDAINTYKQVKNLIKISDQQKNIKCNTFCCCYISTKQNAFHKLQNKFKIFYRKSQNIQFYDIINKDNQDKITQFTNQTQFYLKQENMIIQNCLENRGRNREIFLIIQQISKSHILNVYGHPGSEKTSIVRKAISYILQRNPSKQQQNFYIEINLQNCKNKKQFTLQFIENVKGLGSRLFQYNEIINKLKQKYTYILFDNCDSFIQNNEEVFRKQLKYLQVNLTKVKIVLISKKKLQLVLVNHQKLSLTQYFYQMPYLEKRLSAELFLNSNCKIYAKHRNFQKLIEEFQQYNSHHSQYLKNLIQQFSKTSGDLYEFLHSKLSNQWNESAEKNLLQDLKKNYKSLYKLLLFICQFSDGLSTMDITLIVDLIKGQQARDWPITTDWKQILNQYIKDFQSDKHELPKNQMQQDIMQQSHKTQKSQKQIDLPKGDYYFFTIQHTLQFKQIKVKKYFVQKIQKLEDNMKIIFDLKLKSLRYLSLYSIGMVELFCSPEKQYYYQKLYQFSNISDTGIFAYRKINKFRDYFDQNQYFPDVPNVSKISNTYSYAVRNQDKQILKMVKKKFDHPEKSILQHKSNFLSFYDLKFDHYQNFQYYIQSLKYIYHYFYVLILNIPTLINILKEKLSPGFFSYCLEKSLNKVQEIKNKPKLKANLLMKLHMMKIGQLQRSSLAEQQKIQKYHEITLQIQKILNQNYQNMPTVIKFWQVQKLMLDYYLKINYKNDQIIQSFDKAQQLLSKMTIARLKQGHIQIKNLKNRLLLLKCQFLLQNRNQKNSQVYSIYKEKFKITKIIKQLQALVQQLHPDCKQQQQQTQMNNISPQISLRYELNLIELKFKNLQLSMEKLESQEQLEQIKNQILIQKFQLEKIKDKIFSLNIPLFKEKFITLYKQINNTIWNNTQNLFIFMRASPLINQTLKLKKNRIRQPSELKSRIQTLKQKRQMNNQISKQVSVIWNILTYKNFTNIIRNCLCLVLTIDFEINQKNQIYAVFQHESLPIQDMRNVQDFYDYFFNCQIGIIILCGKNTTVFLDFMHKKRNSMVNSPAKFANIISVETLKYQNEIEKYKTLTPLYSYLLAKTKRIYIEKFIYAFYKNILKVKSTKKQIENVIISGREYILQKMRQYGNQFSKIQISENNKSIQKSAEFLSSITTYIDIKYQIYDNIQINLQEGDYKDISGTYRTSSFDDSQSKFYVGKQTLIISIIKFLIKQKIQSQDLKKFNFENYNDPDTSYLNIYGVFGVGKSELIFQVAWPLLLKGLFSDGIYNIDGQKIKNQSLLDYLQTQNSELFKKLQKTNEKNELDLLIVIDNFGKLQYADNEQFFKIVLQKKITLVIITTRKYNKKQIYNKNIVSIQLKSLNKIEYELVFYQTINLMELIKKEQFIELNTKFQLQFQKIYLKHKDNPKEIMKLFKQVARPYIEITQKTKNNRKESALIIQSVDVYRTPYHHNQNFDKSINFLGLPQIKEKTYSIKLVANIDKNNG